MLRPHFCLFESGCFIQVLLYVVVDTMPGVAPTVCVRALCALSCAGGAAG